MKVKEQIFEELKVKPLERFNLIKAGKVNFFAEDKFYLTDNLKLCCDNPNLQYEIYLGDLLDGKYLIYKKPLLSKEEREYLSFKIFETLERKDDSLQYNIGSKRIFERFAVLNITRWFNFGNLEVNRKYTREELRL